MAGALENMAEGLMNDVLDAADAVGEAVFNSDSGDDDLDFDNVAYEVRPFPL